MTDAPPKATLIVNQLYESEITHVVYLIGKTIMHMIDLLAEEERITLIPVCREADTFAVAAGLITGGKRTAIMMQNTGVFESGDSIRTLGLDVQLPWLLIVGYRGWVKDEPLKDSAAILLEPTLDAWNIKHETIDTVEEAGKIASLYQGALDASEPLALLITPEIL
jgi:sulfopyruvate decarboxylase TPP-binding subunit